jgi:hypothetical protein
MGSPEGGVGSRHVPAAGAQDKTAGRSAATVSVATLAVRKSFELGSILVGKVKLMSRSEHEERYFSTARRGSATDGFPLGRGASDAAVVVQLSAAKAAS